MKVQLDFQTSSFNFGSEFYDDLFVGSTPEVLRASEISASAFSNLKSVTLRSWIGAWERVRGSFDASWGETPIFSGGVPIDLGESWGGDVGVTLYPTSATQAEIGVRHVSIFRSRDGSCYSSATIPRLQARYQLSRALFVRGIGEYSSQERGALLDPTTGERVFSCDDEGCAALEGSEDHDFRIEALVAYEPSPGSVVFLGYTRQFRDTAAFDFRRVRPVADGLFLKLSYRFRM